jgi:hypothetical protein
VRLQAVMKGLVQPWDIGDVMRLVGDCQSTGLPHASFYSPFIARGEAPRESIEVGALLYYD